MQIQHKPIINHSPQSKNEQKPIDSQKIKQILSKKLSDRFHNPQEILKSLDDQIHFQVEKTQLQILKEKQRQNKIKLVQSRQLKARTQLEQKIKMKLLKSSKKKLKQDKQKLQNKIKARKLKEQFFSERKKTIQQTEFKKRLQKFKQIKAQNSSKIQEQIQKPSVLLKNQTLKRSFSTRSTYENPIRKTKQIQQIQYFKKLESLQKRRIYQKPQKIVSIPQSIDKSQWISKIIQQTQNKFIQKLGVDLWKIQQARIRKQKSLKQKIQKMRKQSEFKQQQRGYRTQSLRQDTNMKMKTFREKLNKKNEKFLTMRNKSTPNFERNFSNNSQSSNGLGMSTKRGILDQRNKMSRTLQNFKSSMNGSLLKAQEYLQKQKFFKIKKRMVSQIEKVLKEEKIQILIK